MENKPKQKMRYTDEELSIIKNSFTGNEELLRAIRKIFLQLPLSVVEQAMLVGLKNQTDLLKVIRKAYLPTLDGDAPFHQVIDLWMTLELKNKSPEDAFVEIVAREKLIDYINQQLNVLEGISAPTEAIKLDDCIKIGPKSKASETYANLVMRNTLIAHSEMQLNMFEMLSAMKDETVEQTKARLLKDSTK